MKNIWVLLFSVLFYSWGAPKFVFILLASTYIDFYLVKYMHNTKETIRKRFLLGLSIALNVGLLAYFKYANFFVDNLNAVLGLDIQLGKIILPIGISFYTFQTLTYSIDVYRRVHDPLEKVNDYILYIMMFPQLIAGPIVRYHQVADQIVNRISDYEDRMQGFTRFTLGLAKKVLVANVLGEQADLIMSMDYNSISTSTAWIGILAYTFQIYFDFSGYSDMAIGIGRMIGFKFPENFNNPYVSKSITEFWRRWHMTLGIWMRDYLYIPLGGNRVKSPLRLYFNLWIVFLISGLWHGASWNFVIWGAYHGIFLVLERLVLNKFFQRIPSLFSHLYAFIVAVLGWVFFRIEDFSQAILYYKRLFAFDFYESTQWGDTEFVSIITLAIVISFITLVPKGLKLEKFFFGEFKTSSQLHVRFIVAVLLFILSLGAIATTDFNPFIYFRF